MRTLICSSLGLLLLAGQAAAELKTYPTEGKPLGVVVSDDPGKWLVITFDRETSFIQFVSAQIYDSGKLCLWEGNPGAYAIVHDADSGTRYTTNIILGSTAPKPPPDEPDDPPPPPPIPDGLWKLTRIAYDSASAMPARHKRQLEDVSQNYAYIVAQINENKITTGLEAREKLLALNREVLPEDDRPAHNVWNLPIKAVLEDVDHNDELAKNMTKIAEAYAAIGKGLKLASEK